MLQAPSLLGFFDTGDALRCLVAELPEEDRHDVASVPPPRRNVLSWMKVGEDEGWAWRSFGSLCAPLQQAAIFQLLLRYQRPSIKLPRAQY
jgi:hypothetical protein